jgi:hypothetical protein
MPTSPNSHSPPHSRQALRPHRREPPSLNNQTQKRHQLPPALPRGPQEPPLPRHRAALRALRPALQRPRRRTHAGERGASAGAGGRGSGLGGLALAIRLRVRGTPCGRPPGRCLPRRAPADLPPPNAPRHRPPTTCPNHLPKTRRALAPFTHPLYTGTPPRCLFGQELGVRYGAPLEAESRRFTVDRRLAAVRSAGCARPPARLCAPGQLGAPGAASGRGRCLWGAGPRNRAPVPTRPLTTLWPPPQ